jgi:DNA-binding NarL/FixJ family response regulator
MTFSVLVADDHAPMRREISETLEESGRYTVAAAAGDSPAAVQAAVETQPDLCLLDIRMPGNGLAAAWEITARLPNTKVVMLTVSRNDDDLFAALRAGASGYLLKDVDIDQLLDALDGVMADEPAISRELVARLVTEFRDRSARRRAVLQPGPAGDTLVLSQATVRSHVAAILRKLRLPDRAAVVQLLQAD